MPLGAPHAERADAARNSQHLLVTARDMLAEQGPDTLTMHALAERACLGKGTDRGQLAAPGAARMFLLTGSHAR